MTVRFASLILSVCALQAAEQRTFKTAEAAAKALVAAALKGEREEVVAILGEDLRDELSTGSPAQDLGQRAVLLKVAQEATVARPDDQDPNKAIVYLGNDEWPFPVPLVKTGAQWRFNGKAGIQEI